MMKKFLSIFLIAILSFFTFVSCKKEEKNEDLKVDFLITDAQLKKIDLTIAEMNSIYDRKEIVYMEKYLFFSNEKGKTVVLEVDDKKTILRAEAYTQKEFGSESLNELQAGMTPFEIIQKLRMTPVGFGTVGISDEKGEMLYYALRFSYSQNREFDAMFSKKFEFVEICFVPHTY